MKIFTLLVLFVGSFLFMQPVLQAATHSGISTTMSTEQMKANKKAFQMQKREAKATHFFAKRGIDFQDPVDKWLWYAIFGWAAGIVLYIIAAATVTAGSVAGTGILAILGYLLFLFGGISFIVWLIKKLGK